MPPTQGEANISSRCCPHIGELMKAGFLVGVAFLAASPNPAAQAAVAFDNFGPGFSYVGDTGFVVGIDGFGVNSVGARFVSESTGTLDRLWVAVNSLDADTNDGLVYTVTTDAGGVPNGALASVQFDDVCPQSICPMGALLSAAFGGSASLQSGVPYWLVASATNPESGFFWFAASADQGPGAVFIQNDLFPDGQTFQVPRQPVFRIDVVADQEPGELPEPHGLLLSAIALLALAVRQSIRGSLHQP